MTGSYTGFAKVDFEFEMRVTRMAEHPRITKPFSDAAWTELDALGRRVDEALKAGDVRLTMGGEPTFVSIDDFESEEWNSTATGPEKRRLADLLIRRLKTRFAPGGFLHYGQGKWYPGESLPRWTFSLYWRADGTPLWSDEALIAMEKQDTRPTAGQAEQLLTGIATELGVEPEMIVPAFEDTAEWLIKEANLPENVSPENSRLNNPEERARIARIFERGLTQPTGYVLPIQRWQAKAAGHRWRSEKWKLRRGQLFLAAGDSPMGFRLPLGALPWTPPEEYPYINTLDPSVPRGPLPVPFPVTGPTPAPAAAYKHSTAQQVASFTAAPTGAGGHQPVARNGTRRRAYCAERRAA